MRKISYWSIEFNTKDEQKSFDSDSFCLFMSYVINLEPQKMLQRDEKLSKAISVEKIYDETKDGTRLFKCVFKSCKYNHSPDYMSSIDGTERPTDKLLSEGDKELTHMCMLINDDEAYTVFEERKSGISMGAAISYFNRLLKSYNLQTGIMKKYSICASIIPAEDFISGLGKAVKISSAELFVERKVIGSGYLNLMDNDENSQDDLTICIKAKPRTSLSKRIIEKTYNRLIAEEIQLTRIRVRGKDISKTSIVLDSLNGKKVDEISVNIQENGIVDSFSILSKMENLLGVIG